jgi:hypothetical protein
MKCAKCNNNQSPGAEPLCGSCWAKDIDNTMDWPNYSHTAMAMLATGKRCRRCHRHLYAIPGDDRSADICINCA